MDSISSEIEFSFSIDENISSNEDLSNYWQIYLKIVGDFEIKLKDKLYYFEEQYCLVELATLLSHWLKREDYFADFRYFSIESDNVLLLGFFYENKGWKIISAHQEYEEDWVFEYSTIENAVNKYIYKLKSYLLDKFNINIEKLLNGEIQI